MVDFRKYNRSPSFRGVPFQVRDDDYAGGRRNETHEYPGGERAMTEDLGRKAYKIQLNAFVVGEDWRKQSRRLQDALEKKGPGELVHPNGKTYIVNVVDFNIRETTALYQAEFSITFVESGEQPAPQITSALTDRLVAAAQTLNIANAAEFLKIGADYVGDAVSSVAAVASSLVANLAAIVDGIDDAVDTATNAMDTVVSVALDLSNLRENVEELLTTPDVWAARVAGATDVITGLVAPSKKNVRALAYAGATTDFNPVTIDQSTATGAAEYRAVVRTNNYNLAQSIAGAATIISQIDAKRRGDVIEIRNDILAMVDSVLNSNVEMSPEFTTALSNLAADIAAVCNDIIAKLPDERDIELLATTPARVLAHKMYNDQSRGVEIAENNLIYNPTFVPAGVQLKVLDK